MSFNIRSRYVMVKQSATINRYPLDNLSVSQSKTTNCSNNYDSVENKKTMSPSFYYLHLPAQLSFFLYMLLLHALFKDMTGEYADAAIQRSLSKQAFLGSEESPTEITVKEFFYQYIFSQWTYKVVNCILCRFLKKFFKLHNLPYISLQLPSYRVVSFRATSFKNHLYTNFSSTFF